MDKGHCGRVEACRKEQTTSCRGCEYAHDPALYDSFCVLQAIKKDPLRADRILQEWADNQKRYAENGGSRKRKGRRHGKRRSARRSA